MASTGSPAPSGGHRARMNIGEVLERLRADFPSVTIPKIRFLEDKGLFKPERTPRATGSSPTTTSSDCATCCGCSATTTSR